MEFVASLCFFGLLITQLYVTIKVEYLGKHEPWAYLQLRNSIFSSSVTLFRVGLLLLQAIQLMLRFHLFHLSYYLMITTAVCLFFPYLRKPSPFLPNCYHGGERFWLDPLVTTSTVYMASGLVAIWNNEFPIAFLCLITTVGSMCYHRHREGQFFNFDNIFACSHFLIYGYSFVDSYHRNFLYFLLGVFGFPIPIYFLKQCGDPADIIYITQGVNEEIVDNFSFLRGRYPNSIVRYSRKSYEFLHLCWHCTSAIGPLIAMLYFAHYETPPILNLSHLGIGNKEVLPLLGLFVSLLLNIIANYFSAAPLH